MNKKLKPIELRNMTPNKEQLKNLKRSGIYLVLDDIMDTYNVGGIFRLADAIAANKVFLCGVTEAPPNIKVKRASVNTWQWVDWEKKDSAVDAIKQLRKEVPGIKIIAVEQDDKSVSFNEADYQTPVALVVGNETRGVNKKAIKKCDATVEMPMLGVNTSLNAIVALSIIAYKTIEKNNLS